MLTAILLVAVGAGAGDSSFETVSGVEVRCLENLRGKVGRARVEVVVGSGALHEDEGARGVAHVLEHLILRPIGFDDSNGATSWDYTTYYRDVRAVGLSTAAAQLIDAIADAPAITEKSFRSEQRIVLRELTERGAAFRLERDPIFGGTRLERTPGGTLDAVESLHLEDVHQFFANNYRKGNVAVILSGAVQCSDTKKAIASALARLPDGGAIPLMRVKEPEPGPFPLGTSEDLLVQGYYWYDASPREEVFWRLVAKHLEQRALEELRKERGITYSPSARVTRRGGGGVVELQVKTDGQSGEAAAWLEDTIKVMRESTAPRKLLDPAFGPVRNELVDNGVRNALAKIRGEPAPVEILDELDDMKLSKQIQDLLVERRSFGTASTATNIVSIIILLLFGAVVAAALYYAARSVMAS